MNCGCRHYIQAQPCLAGTSNLYVDARYAPNSGIMYFSSDGDCYSVDPDGERVCAPNDAQVVTLLHSQYDSCGDCESAAPPPDDPDDPPKKKSDCATVPLPNGGWTYVFPCLCLFPDMNQWPQWCSGSPPEIFHCGSIAGQMSDHWEQPPGQKYHYPSICSDPDGNAPNVAVPVEYATSGESWFRFKRYCYHLPETPTEYSSSGGRVIVGFSGSYESCSDCSQGVQAALCPPPHNPPDTSNAPDIWADYCALKDLADTSVRYFQYGGYCYSLNPTGARGTIPVTATLIGVRDTKWSDCSQCRAGAQAQLCPDQLNASEAPDVWIAPENLPPSGETWIFNYAGWCYSIDGDASTSLIPAGSATAYPSDQFDVCDDCRCSPGKSVPVIKATCCDSYRPEGKTPEELFVPAAKMSPGEVRYFAWDGLCYTVSGDFPVMDLPKGGKTIDPDSQYDSCDDCADSFPPPPPPPPPPGGGDGGGGGGGGRPPIPPPPPPGGGGGNGGGGGGGGGDNPPPDKPEHYHLLEPCFNQDGTLGGPVGMVVQGDLAPGTIIKTIYGICFKVSFITATDSTNFYHLKPSQYFVFSGDCFDCQKCLWKRCDSSPGLRYSTMRFFETHGPVVKDANDHCWVYDGLYDSSVPLPAELSGGTHYDTCADCNTIYKLTPSCGDDGDPVYTHDDLHNLVGAYVKLDGGDICYYVEKVHVIGVEVGPVNVTDSYWTCETCKARYTLTPCSGEGDPICTDTDLSSYKNEDGTYKVISVKHTCYKISEGCDPGATPESVTVDGVFDLCEKDTSQPEKTWCQTCSDCHFDEQTTLDVEMFIWYCADYPPYHGEEWDQQPSKATGTAVVSNITTDYVTFTATMTSIAYNGLSVICGDYSNPSPPSDPWTLGIRYNCNTSKWEGKYTGSEWFEWNHIPFETPPNGCKHWTDDTCGGIEGLDCSYMMDDVTLETHNANSYIRVSDGGGA